MRILHIMASRALGGAETTSADVMLSLHKAGIDQCVVIAKNAPRYAELEAAGIRLAPEILSFPFLLWQKFLLKRLIQREQPDIIHCWMRRAASLLPSSYEGKRPKTIGWFGGYYNPRHFRRCTYFVGVTRDIVTHMAKNGVPKDRAFFIPTFPDITDAPAIDRASLQTAPDAKVLLTLSRLHPKKGIDTFLQALADLPDCVAWIAGDGPLRGELEKLAERFGISDRAKFLGWRTDRAALLRAANVCVLPSRYEPFGTVILEAWAANTPLVACNSAGPAAHVVDQISGLLTPIDDATALAEAIRRALDDKDLRGKLITAGHSTYMQDYTREAVTQKWLDVYKQILSETA